jgi:hypothetical protein
VCCGRKDERGGRKKKTLKKLNLKKKEKKRV